MTNKETKERLIIKASKQYIHRAKLKIDKVQNLQSLGLDLDFIQEPTKPKKKNINNHGN
jgi:hypothetical protein